MKLHFTYTKYVNGDRLAVQLREEDGMPFATLSANIDGADVRAGEFVMKDWSENAPIAAAVRGLGVFEDTGRTVAMPFGGWAKVYRAPETPPAPFEFEFGDA